MASRLRDDERVGDDDGGEAATAGASNEVDALLQVLRHPVYRAIAMVIDGTGLRIDEALSLEVGDIERLRCA